MKWLKTLAGASVCATAIVIAVQAQVGSGQEPGDGRSVPESAREVRVTVEDSPFPLAEAALKLTTLYGVPISYEGGEFKFEPDLERVSSGRLAVRASSVQTPVRIDSQTGK